MKRTHLVGLVLGLAMVAMLGAVPAAFAQEEAAEGEQPAEKPAETTSTLKTVAAYGLGVIGFGALALGVVQTMSSNLSYPQGKLMLTNLLRTSANQAEAVCKASPGTFFEPIGAAIKTAAMAQTTDPAVIASATLPTYDAVAGAVSAKWKQLIGKGKLALGAAVVGAGLASAGGSPSILLIILAVLAAASFGWLFVHKSNVESSMMRARAEVLPEVDRAFVAGRYVRTG